MNSRQKTQTLVTLLASALGAASVLTSFVEPASAVGTRFFVLNDEGSFDGGDLSDVAIASDGTVRAGLALANAPIADATSVWASVTLSDGTVLLGTGTGGRIYKVKNGQVSIAAETGAMAVSALTLGPGGAIYAGTFPDGQIFKLTAGELDGSKKKPWVTLDKTEDVWALAYDSKKNALFAATGPDGKLFRISDAGKADVFFDSEEGHLVSVAVAPDGAVYTGSNGKGLLLRVDAPGRARVIHDFDSDDVKAIAIAKDGTLYVVANEYKGMSGLRPNRSGSGLGTSPTPPTPSQPGKGQLWRFSSDGSNAEQMIDDGKTHFVSLALDANGVPFVGTGHEGRVYSVDDNHVVRLVVDTDERQVGALDLSGPQPFVATGDPVVFHAIKGPGGADAIWTSKVLDAGLRASWGMLSWTGEGTLEIQTRSGNTDKPDDTWSAWSGAIQKPGKVQSPPARFIQVRAQWGKDAQAVLRELKVAFVTDNARALVTELKAGDSKASTGGKSVPESGSAPDKPSTSLNLSWKVDNPDNDKLRYRLFYQREGDKVWFDMLEPNEELTKTSYSWDTSGMPEGRYR
ncbi:MAG: WD40 repeat domain-containing protein, partial [Myxococcales bacterium]|nr:WD40 repeat domain-containing protein [Myxococcales bacterium]